MSHSDDNYAKSAKLDFQVFYLACRQKPTQYIESHCMQLTARPVLITPRKRAGDKRHKLPRIIIDLLVNQSHNQEGQFLESINQFHSVATRNDELDPGSHYLTSHAFSSIWLP